MGFLEHLQSSVILGTNLDLPQSSNFDIERINLFFHAIQSNDHKNLINMILEGFNVETPHHKTHITPLMYAIELKQESLALALVNYGASIYAEDTKENSILFLALKNKLHALSELIIENGGFKLQSLKMKKATFEYIVQKSKTPLENYEDLLYKTPKRENIFNIVQKGDIHNLLFFLYQKPKTDMINSKKQSLLHLAVMSGSVAMTSFLLNRGLNIDAKDEYGNFPLIYAAHSANRIEVLKLLINRGATLDQANHGEHNTLTMAIRKHNFVAIDILIKAGANINQRDGIHTALSLTHDQLNSSISQGKKESFRKVLHYLHVHGGHVNTPGDTIGWTPLQLTMNYEDTSFYLNHATKLIQLGAKLDLQDNVGRTPLMIAAALGRLESIKLLAKEGANLDLVDHYGWSALMLAVYNNKLDVVRELIVNKAAINLTTQGQLSALKIAIDQKNRRIERYLRDNGATTD